jgi:hypothetical protein
MLLNYFPRLQFSGAISWSVLSCKYFQPVIQFVSKAGAYLSGEPNLKIQYSVVRLLWLD